MKFVQAGRQSSFLDTYIREAGVLQGEERFELWIWTVKVSLVCVLSTYVPTCIILLSDRVWDGNIQRYSTANADHPASLSTVQICL